MATGMNISVAQIVPCTEAEGPGKRFAIWVQGCPLRCPGCCNPEMLPFEGGAMMCVGELIQQIEKSRIQGVEGISLLGGEPFAHADSLAILAAATQSTGLSVMVYSGYTLGELQSATAPAVRELLRHIDLLVDGRYDRTQPESTRRWIGSANQQIHFLTDRYSPDDPCWKTPDTLEIRWDGKELVVNGFPARAAIGLWKRSRFGEITP